MTVQLENEFLIATIAEAGAELVSLRSKSMNIEYIWQGNPAFWNRHSPILFPIVGRLKNNQYIYEGKTYHLPQHGFARDQLFQVIEQSDQSATFSLKSTKETYQYYPFDFELVLTYELEEQNLIVRYQVENLGIQTMYFSIGGHPAFNVPLEETLTFEDYFLNFFPKKSRTQIPLSGSALNIKNKTLAQTNTSIDLIHELFKNDALIFETKGNNAFSIETDKSQHGITLSYTDAPYVGIWSPYPKKAPFVCIEPWWGIADTIDTDGQLTNKLGIQLLSPNRIFNTHYQLTIK
ncbi:aldose 1-epimerase family protein [Melissococcus plutonius]|uniref:LacX protein, plasmid n=1 Tax=Melissococcus plutonius (strain ATCC 35311 / DSM 29964 / CIP 104052 / LMG 20360 / NCIMB 702443) TaxID=940190 RepID=F3YAP0_MELPT|nr:aldose 1-epimerase family protein [Melissococcus plutonius]AIM25034.1 protein LacX, chromosomal [Melissococcus plutonius S1]KMT25259.1 protein LacX, chromosomal [Melissococcus plutonius]KMT26165.1 protein LacX, chromosomal [Melissococcus plutonius]KMT26895.1 protein LacX, chromosomal [Melissococcus plutonius]KMT28905.1 protein LacX, chromosomal [Melissococcus plutonius]